VTAPSRDTALRQRPASVVVTAAALILAGALALVAGFVAGSLSGCCEGDEGGDALAYVLGMVCGAASASAGALLWLGRVASLVVRGWVAVVWITRRRSPAGVWLSVPGA
jgi:hypothetical protein